MKNTEKKVWHKPEIYLLSTDNLIEAKNNIGNHEIHNGKGSKVTVIGGGVYTNPIVYNSAQSVS